ncbi:MAG: hypothetical protein H0U86_08095 [Chloroflexi bacterium]|nr:hypothetical protein [Chloroflexota bacterium]
MMKEREVIDLWERWRNMSAALADPGFELTVEEFAPLLLAFRRLEAAGVEFDPALVGLMACLSRQIINTDDDCDNDIDASDHEREEDYDDMPLPKIVKPCGASILRMDADGVVVSGRRVMA